MARPFHFTTLLAFLFFLVPSCGPSTAPLLVQLRDAQSHAPLANAPISADSLALGPSLQLEDVVEELKGTRVSYTSRTFTDGSGLANLTFIPDRAVNFTLPDPARGIPFLLVPAAGSETDWLPMNAPTTSGAAVELRVLHAPPALGPAR